MQLRLFPVVKWTAKLQRLAFEAQALAEMPETSSAARAQGGAGQDYGRYFVEQMLLENGPDVDRRAGQRHFAAAGAKAVHPIHLPRQLLAEPAGERIGEGLTT